MVTSNSSWWVVGSNDGIEVTSGIGVSGIEVTGGIVAGSRGVTGGIGVTGSRWVTGGSPGGAICIVKELVL